MTRKTLTAGIGLVLLLVLNLLISTACTEKKVEESKNLEQIYKEEGLPVRVETVKQEDFKVEISFNSVLSGIKESGVYAPIGDKIEKIHVKVGDYVKKDQILLTFPTDSPSAQYNQAKVAFENYKAAYKRIEKLYKSGGISLQERDNTRAAFQVAKANWAAARQSIKVKAPINGYVTRVAVSETDNVKKENELFIISQTDRMKAKIWLSEEQIFEVKTGMPATASWKGYEIQGKVIQVDMGMNQYKKAFQAQVEFDNTDNLLKPGTTVEVKIATHIQPGALVVKRQHLIKDGENFAVYVVNDSKAHKREVKTGKQHVLDVEILEGLTPGDQLVVEGQTLLTPDAKVKVIK